MPTRSWRPAWSGPSPASRPSASPPSSRLAGPGPAPALELADRRDQSGARHRRRVLCRAHGDRRRRRSRLAAEAGPERQHLAVGRRQLVEAAAQALDQRGNGGVVRGGEGAGCRAGDRGEREHERRGERAEQAEPADLRGEGLHGRRPTAGVGPQGNGPPVGRRGRWTIFRSTSVLPGPPRAYGLGDCPE